MCNELTNVEYLDLLKRAREYVRNLKVALGKDSDTVGSKYTWTNVGLCNEELTTKETALLPEQWEQCNRTMKYLKRHHKCPLDWREASMEVRSGCFYTCLFFQKKYKNIERIIALYDERIREVESGAL